jgi:hypothetical protein
VTTVAAVIRWCWKMCHLWIRSLYLFGDDEDDGVDCGVGSFLQKSRIILYFPLYLESFVIGFANKKKED